MGLPVILIPVKPFALAKSRLAAVLSDAERAAFSRRLFEHVLAQALRLRDAADVWVVSRDEEVLALARAAGATGLRETGEGHNAALAQALLELDRLRRAPVLIVSSDLPRLSPGDLRAMLTPAKDAQVVIAADTEGQGTNALYLAQPTAMRLRFGPNSCSAHAEEAARAGLDWVIERRAGLAQDVDVPADLQNLLTRA